MSVLVWDGTTLAADKRASSGCSVSTVTKIFKLNGKLIGIAGDLAVGLAMVAWFENHGKPEDFPEFDKEDDAVMVVIHQNEVVEVYETSPYPFICDDVPCAFGCGEQAALVAMALGLDAKEAVEIVSRFNIYCGNGIDELSFAW